MNITTYFIKHPVTAIILNAMIIVIGILSFNSLSVREYPEVQSLEVSVRTSYPNASAELVETTITNILEDKLATVENIDIITSDSQYGESYITLTFKNGTSIDRSLVAIREAISLARLPTDVRSPIVKRATKQGLPFMIISLESASMDFAQLTHYAELNLKNAFRSLKGVASVEIWGQPYTYDITLDAKKMYAFGINADDVLGALKRGNLSLPVGKFQNEISVTLHSELKTVKDYENLIIKEKNILNNKLKQSAVFLKDVASIKLKSDNRNFRVRVNGKPGLCIGIRKASDAHFLDVSTLVRAQLDNIRINLPKDIQMNMISDQAEFVRHSIKNIKSSIIEAIIFVVIVVFLFLRNIRATIIPLITIPISLIGAFLFMKIFGFSINVLTLLAMVLAIGLVVDDAIVVLENIQRYIDKGLSAFEAAVKGSKEIGFAIIAMTLTLTSVYAPLAFIKGSIGILFTEFAVALAGSILISGVVALTLSPLMCSKMFKSKQSHLWSKIDDLLNSLTKNYEIILRNFLLYKKSCLCILIIIFGLIAVLYSFIPSETAPKEDRCLIGVFVPKILEKDINTMEKKIKSIEDTVKFISEAQHNLVFMGDFGGYVVLPLKPQTLRSRSAQEIVDSIKPSIAKIPSIDAYPWSLDSGLPGVNSSRENLSLSLVVSTTESYLNLFNAVEKVKKSLDQQKLFEKIGHDLKLDTASYRIDIDVNEMAHLNLTNKQIAKTIEVFFSGDRSLDFSKDGILYSLTVKGKQSSWGLNELYVTNKFGKKISLGAVAKIIPTSGPDKLYHYNQMRSVVLNAGLLKNETFEQGMNKFFNHVNKTLPPNYKKTWTGNVKTYMESEKTMMILFLLAIVFIFAILAVQFENFIDPFIILLTVPLSCFGALLLVWIFKGSINIYTQIGLITLVGLITKHGILIVEFTNQLRKKISLTEAIIKASLLRLRPILMTTITTVFGAVPLILSYDAGFEARRAIGLVLVGGLIFGTLFTLFILPTMCYVVKSFTEKRF